MEKVAPGKAIYAALLTPQGKVLFDFLIAPDDEVLLLDCPAADREALIKRLTMYKLRAKVALTARDDLAVIAAWGEGLETASLEAHGFRDPRHPELGARAITVRDATAVLHDDYIAHRLALGVPEGKDFGSDAMFALDADLDELHAIAFDKGCYVGQELTARMKHRGTARKRLLPAKSEVALLSAGASIRAGTQEIGEIMSVYGTRAFALVRLDRLGEAGDTPLTVGDSIAIELIKPSWLSA
jgi:folate-binding protein YgfZ